MWGKYRHGEKIDIFTIDDILIPYIQKLRKFNQVWPREHRSTQSRGYSSKSGSGGLIGPPAEDMAGRNRVDHGSFRESRLVLLLLQLVLLYLCTLALFSCPDLHLYFCSRGGGLELSCPDSCQDFCSGCSESRSTIA